MENYKLILNIYKTLSHTGGDLKFFYLGRHLDVKHLLLTLIVKHYLYCFQVI